MPALQVADRVLPLSSQACARAGELSPLSNGPFALTGSQEPFFPLASEEPASVLGAPFAMTPGGDRKLGALAADEGLLRANFV